MKGEIDVLRTGYHQKVNISPRTMCGHQLPFECHGYPVAYSEDAGYFDYSYKTDF